MCGICGIAGLTNQQESSLVIRRMNNALSHRGPDAEGYYIKEQVAFGHRRLSIIDLSVYANQPFTEPTGRWALVFNGEIYNYKEVRDQLPQYHFTTSSDTEVILAAYIQWGPSCLEKFRGMFAFALWDEQEKKLFIARDRLGVKPLYYYCKEGHFLFASEIRSVLSSNLVKRQLNKQSLADYLKYQSIITPFTLIEGIFQLPAGHYLYYSDGKVEITRYWNLAEASRAQTEDTVTDVKKNIRHLLYQSVERRLVSDVPVGAFLSGGIDSTAVVAIMAQVSKEKPIAFTIGFKEKKYDETPYAEMVAKKYKVLHHKITLEPDDFLQELTHGLDAMDTPSGDGINTYVVSKAIRQSGIKVALSGVGGDELFIGYPVFDQFKKLQAAKSLFNHTRFLRKAFSALIPGGNQRRDRIKSLLQSPDTSIAHIYPLLRQIQTNANLDSLTNLPKTFSRNGSLEKLLEANAGKMNAFDPYGQVTMGEYLGYTQHVLLKDTDQMSMAVALEIREPFFDHDLVEYVTGLPDAVKGTAYPKQLLVESLQPLVPEEIVFRKKQGFVLPYDVWMRNELKDFCAAKIKQLAARSYFNGRKLTAYWQNFVQGKADIRWADIWIFIVLEHWLEKNNISTD